MTTPETASQTTRRRVVGSLSALVLILILAASAVISPVMHPGPGASGGPRLDSTADLLWVRGLSGTITTLGTVSAGDGGAMSYSVTDSLPAGDLGDIAVPLADGRWAVPEGLPTAPRTVPDPAAVEDTVARAMTFAAAGEALHWDSGRATPLSGQVVHDTQTRPYAVTASAFVGMVLRGWDYEHTTYVAGGNTQVGQAVDFGTTSGAELGQASRLARWFYAHGDLWLDTDGQYQRGDVLFFSNTGARRDPARWRPLLRQRLPHRRLPGGRQARPRHRSHHVRRGPRGRPLTQPAGGPDLRGPAPRRHRLHRPAGPGRRAASSW